VAPFHLLARLLHSANGGDIMRSVLSKLLWPGLAAGSLFPIYLGMEAGHGILAFNVTYLSLALAIALLERVMPHEKQWLANDGQMGPDLAHTVLSKGIAQVIVTVIVFMGIAAWL